ncbi:MAG: sulfurtransferase [Acidimicrobiales bacterium]
MPGPRLAAAALALLLVAAGCGSSDSDTTEAQPGTAAPSTDNSATETTNNNSGAAPTTMVEAAAVDVLVGLDELDAVTASAILVDVRSADAYTEGHIEGAVNLPSNLLDDPDSTVGSQVSSAEVVADALGSVGIGPDDTVVLYDGTSSLYAARVFFAARLYGHDDLRILDGGMVAWEAEGRPLSSEPATVEPVDYPVGDGTGAVRYELDDVTGHLDEGGTFADARAGSEYTGETRFGDEEGGHIPGAVNLDWEQTVGADGRFLDTDTLRTLYADAGIGDDSPVVTYCYIGVRAAHTWFVLSELLGYPDVALYDGSWSEYGTTNGVEIES